LPALSCCKVLIRLLFIPLNKDQNCYKLNLDYLDWFMASKLPAQRYAVAWVYENRVTAFFLWQ
jgi:hypothetical protein